MVKEPFANQVFETAHAAGAAMALHRHGPAIASLVLAGGYVEFSADGCFAVEAGDLIVHPPFHAHGDVFGSSKARVLNVVLKSGAAPWDIVVARPRRPDSLAKTARRAPERAGGLFLDAATDARPIRRLAPPRPLAQAAELWRRCATFSIAEAARGAGVTPEHFSRAFKAHFGMAPTLYRGEHRFRRAERLIVAGRPLADAAAEAGYADQSHMTRDFRLRAAPTPKRFRPV